MQAPTVEQLVAPAVMISACGVLMIAASTRHASVIAQLHGLHRERVELVSRLTNERRAPNHAEAVRVEGLELLSESMLSRARALRLGLLGIVLCVVSMLIVSGVLALAGGAQQAAVIAFMTGVVFLMGSMVAHVYEIVTSLRQVQLEHDRVSGVTLRADGEAPEGV